MLQVLVVCAANQCRSRLAEELLRSTHAASHLTITSAGTEVDAPAPICAFVSEFLSERAVPIEPNRMSAPVSRQHLADADLVLAADARVRAAIVTLDPDVRRKTLLLRPAGLAAAHLLETDMVELARRTHADGQPHATEIVDDEPQIITSALGPNDAARWLAEELAVAQTMVGAIDGHDIIDAHTDPRADHRRTLLTVANAIDPLALLLRQLTESKQR